jgi:hypothetical protein
LADLGEFSKLGKKNYCLWQKEIDILPMSLYNKCHRYYMEQKPDFLTEHALVSRLKAYYALLPKGYMDTLVGMAMASSTGCPPHEEGDKGDSPSGLIFLEIRFPQAAIRNAFARPFGGSGRLICFH